MNNETIKLLGQILQTAAASNNALLALICLIVGVIAYLVFKNVTAWGKIPLFIAFTLFLGTVVFLVLAVQTGIQDPKRIYYVGDELQDDGGSQGKKTNVGVFARDSSGEWWETSLRPEQDPYAYHFAKSRFEDGILFLIDTDRKITVRVDTNNKLIHYFWTQPDGTDGPLRYLYRVLVIL
jgi:hypothetical protein